MEARLSASNSALFTPTVAERRRIGAPVYELERPARAAESAHTHATPALFEGHQWKQRLHRHLASTVVARRLPGRPGLT